MILPPWVKQCSECQVRYALDPVCPVCREKAEWQQEHRRTWRDVVLVLMLLCLLLVVAVAVLLTRQL